MTPNLQLAGGMAYDVYKKDSMTGDPMPQSYWLVRRYRPEQDQCLLTPVQDNINVGHFRHDCQVGLH